MFLPVQGVHSLELAGALVAGANDADALWLNPAGLARFTGYGTTGLEFDVAYLYQPTTYTPPAVGVQPGLRVANQQPGEGLPSLAGAIGVDDHWVLGGGLTWKYAPTSSYNPAGSERYASTGVSGTQYVEVLVGAAYVITPRLRVGATLQDLVTILDLAITASACPGAQTCDPGYDMPLAIKATQAFTPSGSIGVQYDAMRELTIGAVVQAPTRISDSSGVNLTLPDEPVFRGLALTGASIAAKYWLPPSVRAGVQYHDGIVSVEAAADVELWSLQDSIDIAFDDVKLGTMTAHDVSIARDYKTTVALSLGGEVQLGVVRLGAGLGYETAAAPPATVSVLTIDAPKFIFGLGGGYAAEGWQIGAGASFVYQRDVDVTSAGVAELEPFHDTNVPATLVNAGVYHAFDVMAGLRLARTF
jgi:long-subunit fatty acid transport protein